MELKKVSKRGGMKAAITLSALALLLSGCVVYPSAYGYGRYGGYYAAPAVYAAPAYYRPAVVVGVGGGWGWRGGYCWR